MSTYVQLMKREQLVKRISNIDEEIARTREWQLPLFGQDGPTATRKWESLEDKILKLQKERRVLLNELQHRSRRHRH